MQTAGSRSTVGNLTFGSSMSGCFIGGKYDWVKHSIIQTRNNEICDTPGAKKIRFICNFSELPSDRRLLPGYVVDRMAGDEAAQIVGGYLHEACACFHGCPRYVGSDEAVAGSEQGIAGDGRLGG